MLRPIKNDSAAVLNEVAQLKQSFAETNDAASFVNTKNSDIAFSDEYVTANNLKGSYKDSLLKLKDGEVFGPYLDNKDYTIAKMIAHRVVPDSAKCRHILIKTEEQGKQVLDDSTAKKE